MFDAFYKDVDRFRELYETAERNTKLRKKKIKAIDLFSMFIQERKDTGRVYLMNVDHANSHGSFIADVAPIRQSNLCCEIDLPTKPLNDINDPEGEIALCTLSALNWGVFKNPEDMERACTLAVRGLDALLSYQHYPILAAQLATENRRPLGVGIINLAYWLAKNDLSYSDPAALAKVDEWAQHWSYYLIKASADLAEEFGACPKSNETKYHLGVLPVDTYKREVDELVTHRDVVDWTGLRDQLKRTGIRNSTLMALMPAETSAQISNATNGIEPPRSYVSIKQSKDGVLKQVVPEYRRLKNKYELLWDQKSPEGYLKICAVLQKYIDQGISVNTSYNPQHYDEEKITMSDMLKHLVMFYKYGGKQLYYFNTYDGSGEIDIERVSRKSILIESVIPTTNDEIDDCDSCKI
jgi:ribonucleoside-diphosphate reductase alpha chain